MILKVFSNKNIYNPLCIVLISLILASCSSSKTALTKQTDSSTLQNDILNFSKKHIGKPYRYAGKGPNSFDCSGFTSYVFKKFGYNLHSSSAGQDRQLPTITKKENLSIGDLVFFEGSRKNGAVGHVGIVTETFDNGEFKFIHASISDGVIISSSTEPYYSSRYLRGGKIIDGNNRPTKLYSQSSSNQPKVKEVTPTKINFQKNEIRKTEKSQPEIHVQSSPSKNPPLTIQNSQNKDKNSQTKNNSNVYEINSDIVLREEEQDIAFIPKTHTVISGETLFSISRKYGCTIEQIKKWNPQLDSTLRAGEKLRIFISPKS